MIRAEWAGSELLRTSCGHLEKDRGRWQTHVIESAQREHQERIATTEKDIQFNKTKERANTRTDTATPAVRGLPNQMTGLYLTAGGVLVAFGGQIIDWLHPVCRSLLTCP